MPCSQRMHCPCVGLFLFFNFQMHNWAQHSIRFLLYYPHVVQCTLPYQCINIEWNEAFYCWNTKLYSEFYKISIRRIQEQECLLKVIHRFFPCFTQCLCQIVQWKFCMRCECKKRKFNISLTPKEFHALQAHIWILHEAVLYIYIHENAYIHWRTYKNVIEKYPVAGNGCSRRTEWIHRNERNG